MSVRRAAYVLALAFAIIGVVTKPAYAYLDPGTISMVLQGIIGAIAAGFVAIKMNWYRFKAFISGNKGEEEAGEEEGTESGTKEE